MFNKGSIFKNQSPWGSSGSDKNANGNGSGSRREPPSIDDLIGNLQKLINKFRLKRKGGPIYVIVIKLVDSSFGLGSITYQRVKNRN